MAVRPSADEDVVFASPGRFAGTCVRVAIALGIIGLVGLVDRLFVLPLAGLLLVVAVLATLAGVDRLDDAEADLDPEPDLEPDLALEPAPVAETRAAPEPELEEAPEPVLPLEPRTERTFRLPAAVGATQVHLVGEFNDWSPTSVPMRREGDWFTAVVALEPGRSYRYRYLLDGSRWENDWDADAYVPNEFGTDDSLVRT
jgi:hypothetical protein